MNSRVVLYSASLLLAASVTGCKLKPTNMPITDRDRITYQDPEGISKSASEEALPVAILVKADEDSKGTAMVKALDASLTNVISDFAFFSIIERSNLDSLQAELSLTTLNEDSLAQIDIPEAEYLITANVASTSFKPQLLNSGAYTAQAMVDYRFYELVTGRTILTKNIEGTSSAILTEQSGPASDSAFADAVAETAKAFATELGAMYAPPARVLETRGEGKVALISIGNNYGVAANAKIEFFEYVDNSDLVEGAVREPSAVGFGYVVETTGDSAWVNVDNYKKVTVLRGHYARLANDQTRGMKDSMRNVTRVF